MEPRFFNHGDGNPTAIQWPIGMSGFNGATVFQPWRRYIIESIHNGPIQDGFQWSHGFSTMETNGDYKAAAIALEKGRFNGATVFQPWRHRIRDHGGPTGYTFQWSHGFSTMETAPIASQFLALFCHVSMEPRFFNHGDHDDQAAYHGKRHRVSMEPRFFNHGDKRKSTPLSPCSQPLFQWSHGFSTMETPWITLSE